MVEVINNLTEAGNSIYGALSGLFVVVALLALAVVLIVGVFARDRGRAELVKNIGVVVGVACGFASIGSIVAWAMGLGA